MPVSMVIIPMVVISMSSLAKKEKIILVTCITRVFKEIITLVICFACFYNFVNHLNSYSSKVSKVAKIRNRYNQVPHLTQDTNGKVTNSQKTPQTRGKRSALSQQVTTKHI